MASAAINLDEYGMPDMRAAEGGELRPLPNEDVCWFFKEIDNSKVARRADPKFFETLYRFLVVAASAVVLVIGLLAPNVYGLLAGRRLVELEATRTRLTNRIRILEREQAELLRLERLAGEANRRGFKPVPLDNTHYLSAPPDGSQEALLRTRPRKR